MKRVSGGLLIFGVLAVPPMRLALEQTMVGHMLLQLPLLVLCGILIGQGLHVRVRGLLQAANGYGVTGLVLAIVTALFWMLPRHLDAALEEAGYEAAKFISLPLLIGIPLQLSWHRLTAIGRGLIWSNLVAMLWVLSWLYLAAPVRVCNNYLIDEQTLVGRILFSLGALIAAALAIRAFIPSQSATTAPEPPSRSPAAPVRKG